MEMEPKETSVGPESCGGLPSSIEETREHGGACICGTTTGVYRFLFPPPRLLQGESNNEENASRVCPARALKYKTMRCSVGSWSKNTKNGY